MLLFFVQRAGDEQHPDQPKTTSRMPKIRCSVEHIEPLPEGGCDGIDPICKVLGRTFEWVAEAEDPSEKGLHVPPLRGYTKSWY
ncbi:MAG: hypothetical protein ACOYOI_04415 [Chthoniobacterales bacterium]